MNNELVILGMGVLFTLLALSSRSAASRASYRQPGLATANTVVLWLAAALFMGAFLLSVSRT
jgi:hypothetical protein